MDTIEHFLPLKPADLQVLIALSGRPRHGYGIMKAVEKQSGGSARLELGSLYRLLARIESSGLIEEAPAPSAEVDDRRRYYRLTSLGGEALRLEARRLQSVIDLMRSRNLTQQAQEAKS